jgi:transposase
LLERGLAVKQGQHFLRAELPRILGASSAHLSPRMAQTIEDLAGDWRRLDERIDRLRVREGDTAALSLFRRSVAMALS